MARMGRPTENERKTTIGIRKLLGGWVAFKALDGSASGYLNSLAEADRARALADDGEIAARYRHYLQATGRTEELEAVMPRHNRLMEKLQAAQAAKGRQA